MNQKIIIKLAREKDIHDIIEVAQISWRDVYEGIIPPNIQKELLNNLYSPNALKETFKNKKSWFYVAENKNRVIGYAQFILCGKNRGELSRIYVLPEWQRDQIGSKLLEKGKEILTHNGVKELFVKVEKRNEKGINFYIKKGFQMGSEYNEEISKINIVHVGYKLILRDS